MCYICNCFAWTLDLVQRFITFALGCVMALAICCGMSVAIVAGIAYGYNYSLAEFLTFSRSDITVYMRRGQFLDKPDLQPSRRSGDETYDLLSSNITSEYQEESAPEDTNPLSNTWLKAEDTRRYAEKLTKYSSKNRIKENLLEPVMRADNLYYKLTTPPRRRISILPNREMPTVMVQSGSSDIIMREFRPVEQLTSNPVDRDYDYVNFDKSEKAKSEASEQTTEADTSDVETEMDSTSNYTPMRSWGTTNSPPIAMDYPTEDTDEDNIVYKPV